MRQKIQNAIKQFVVFLCAICMCLGLCFVFGGQTAVYARADDAQTAEVTGVQIKRVTYNGSQFAFIALQSPIFEGMAGNVDNVASYNFRDKITIYSSRTDTTGVTLGQDGASSIIGTWCAYNYMDWAPGLLLFYQSAASWWSGKQIYKMTIEAGCELPCGDTVYTTAETVTFVNMDWNEDAALENANHWVKYDPETDCEVADVQFRNISAGENFIVLQSPVYYRADLNRSVGDVSGYNTASKVKVYVKDKDTMAVTEVTQLLGGWWEYSYNADNPYSMGLWLAYNNQSLYSTYNGQTIYKIVIEGGCDLPCGAGEKCVTTETRTFYNLDWGKTGDDLSSVNWQQASFVGNSDAGSEPAGTLHIEDETVSGMYYEGVFPVEGADAEDTSAYYFINRRAAAGVNAEVKFVTEGTADDSYAPVKTAVLSFDYKITNSSVALIAGAEESYSVQVILSDGTLSSLEFAPMADGEWHTQRYTFARDVYEKFCGFTVTMGGLQGEMLLADIAVADDTTPPVITVNGITSEYDEGATLIYDVTASDAVYGTTAVTVQTEEGMTDDEGKLLPGTWTIKFLSEDTLGNQAESTEYTITVNDKTPPAITIEGTTAYEAETAYTEGLPAGMTVTITDNVDGTISAYTVELQNGAVVDGKLQVGTWTVTVKASDDAGNEGTTTKQITVTDTQKPVITLDNEKTVTQYNEGDELNIVASAADSYDGTVDVVFDIPDGAVSDGKLQAGEWKITLTASDRAGNAAEPVTVDITAADKTPPVITLGGRTEYGAGTAYTENSILDLTVAINDNVNGEITEYTVTLEEGAVADGKLVAGEWTVTVTASDKAGNENSETIDITVAADSTPPDITLGGTTAYEAGTAYTENSILDLTVEISDNVDGAISAYTVELQNGAVIDGKLQAGTWTVTVKASDDAGNEGTATTQITVTDTQKPVITLDSERTVTQYNEGDELNIVASASDSYDGSIEVEIGIPEGAVADGKLVAGEWTITLTATDAAGNEADPVTVQINVAESASGGCGSTINGTTGIFGMVAAVVICTVVLVIVFKRKKQV